MQIHWNLPLRIISEPNTNQHWSVRYKRAKEQKRCVWAAFYNEQPDIKLPCEVVLTRNAPRKLDDDNLIASFKAIRDEIADHLIPGLRPGMADSSPAIAWHYKQNKSKEYSIDIEIV